MHRIWDSWHGAQGSRRATAGGAVAAALLIGVLVAACGGSTPTASTSTRSNCPSAATASSWHLVNSGQLTIASDTTYPPAEYLDQNNKPVGYDMDLARALAQQLCLTANIQSAPFDSIITSLVGPSLGSQRWDLSISSFTINPTRQQKVDMIPYFQAGESIIVATTSTLQVSDISGLCGKTVAVETGTVEESDVDTANAAGGACVNNRIKKQSFASQDTVIQQVLNGSADAAYQDSPVTDYYVKLNPGKVKSGGFTVAPSPEGIVMRKDNSALETAVTNALNTLRANGTYLKILTTWGAQEGAYPKS